MEKLLVIQAPPNSQARPTVMPTLITCSNSSEQLDDATERWMPSEPPAPTAVMFTPADPVADRRKAPSTGPTEAEEY
ncbi:hypothetical protein [Paractinoplanes abujensis]|uniref:Uncharacterized protein n=1 Tax=Paractinoplanes abujensis TaxID=882441 RepID=A0A7W7CRK5_9ACTN|nr:hypothetical protein [Actinoplanes abujensis]MBB4693421.1 hypothetical protein [Actinoplanes abujensis]